MDPFTLASSGLSLIGSLFSSKSSSSNVDKQILAQHKENELNRLFNAKEAQKSRDYNSRLIERYREYNDPSAVMKRLQAAGLNPNLAVGSIGSGDAMQGSSAQASSQGSISPVGYAPPDFAQSAALMSQSRLNDAQAKKAEAEASKANAEAVTEDALRAGRVEAQGVSISLDKSLIDVNKEKIPQLKADTARLIAVTDESRASINRLSEETGLIKAERLSREFDNIARSKNFELECQAKAAQFGLSIQEYKYYVASYMLRLANLKADTNQKLASAFASSSFGRLANAKAYEQEDRNAWILPREHVRLDLQNDRLSWDLETDKHFEPLERRMNLIRSTVETGSTVFEDVLHFLDYSTIHPRGYDGRSRQHAASIRNYKSRGYMPEGTNRYSYRDGGSKYFWNSKNPRVQTVAFDRKTGKPIKTFRIK